MPILDRFHLDGRVAIVTGASAGLGVAIAQALAEAGADVALAARRADHLENTRALVEAAGRRAITIPTDISDQAQCQALVDATMAEFGRLDVLVNNAGIGTATPALRETPEDFRKVLDVNICGSFWMAQAAARVMKEGSSIVHRGEWNGKPYEDKGTIQSFDVDRRLAFTHWSPLSKLEDKPENYHIVSFDLRPINGSTEVVLTQINQSDNEPLTPEIRQEYAKNWAMLLEGLKKSVEGGGRTEKTGVSAEARN